MAESAKKMFNYFFLKHRFEDEGKFIFYPPHLILTFLHKYRGRGGMTPPLRFPRGGSRPPPVYAPDREPGYQETRKSGS